MTNTLLGRPIEGQISYYSDSPGEQQDIKLLLDSMDNLLDLPEVTAVTWTQYTPYFNDGDACTFSVYEPRVILNYATSVATDMHDDDEEVDVKSYSEYELYEYDRGPDGRVKSYDKENRIYLLDGHSTVELADRLDSFGKLLESGAFNIDLLKSFGDPAEVRATKDGFSVEHYDHE